LANKTLVDPASVQKLNGAFLGDSRTILMFTGTGVTGVVAFVCQLLMYSSAVEAVRRKHFEMFWYTHHLFIVFFIMLLVHGIFGQVSTVSGILNLQNNDVFKPSPTPAYSASFWQWIIPTGFLYTCERLWREIRGRKETRVHKVVFREYRRMTPRVKSVTAEAGNLMSPSASILYLDPGKVCELQVKKPSFRMRPGQYIFVCCPDVSFFQWRTCLSFLLSLCPLFAHFAG
jgi:NADPH oxidase